MLSNSLVVVVEYLSPNSGIIILMLYTVGNE